MGRYKLIINTALVIWIATVPITSSAGSDTLDIQQELSQPGVKLLVVEFYATWCKPCMAAVSEWKALHEKYRKNGLRFIVVSAEGGGTCGKPPDWSPDRSICDEDGSIQKQLGLKQLPQSFLFSWQGSLSLTTHEVGPVKEAIENYFKHSQLKMVVDEVRVIGDKCAVGGNPEWLRQYVAGKIREQSKFDVVNVSREAVLTMSSATCSPEFPPNSVLRIFLEGDCRGNRTMTLAVEKDGCTLASATEPYMGQGIDEDRGSMQEAAAMGITKLMGQLVASRTKKARLVGRTREGKIGYVEIVNDDEEGASVQELVVAFESDPEGAVVMLDGQLLCAKTPCTKMVAAGAHDAMMQAENYLDRHETINAQKGQKVSWKLDPNFGWLSITSIPAGLDVKVDGEVVGKTPMVKWATSPKAHDILVFGDCYYEQGERVVIERNKERTVQIAPIPKTGKVKVKANDKKGNDIESDVYIDGQKVGTSPGIFKVNICSKEIEVKAAKLGGYKTKLVVNEKQMIDISALLKGGLLGDKADLEWVFSDPANLYFTKSEISVAQFEKCIATGKCKHKHIKSKSEDIKCNLGYSDRGNH
ncbi:MAG: PEGA domain-containing protein, partial [Lentisphaerae bacterium]|nr:PEGA domain-containing protein [Lentisphaerota bacterium]